MPRVFVPVITPGTAKKTYIQLPKPRTKLLLILILNLNLNLSNHSLTDIVLSPDLDKAVPIILITATTTPDESRRSMPFCQLFFNFSPLVRIMRRNCNFAFYL
jgi:hypothetical protein